MSRNLYLVKYDVEDLCDDTSEYIEEVYLDDKLYEKLNKYIESKKILETKNTTDTVIINYINDECIVDVINNIVIPECVRASEKIDKKFIDKNIEIRIFSLGGLANVLRLLVRKRDEFHNNPNILVTVG